MDLTTICKTVEELISLETEGDYWDFKVKYHDNNAELIRDIICLANLTHYEGDRFIIFGVDDETYDVKPILDENRKKQADIIDMLKKAGFSNARHPDVHLIQNIQLSCGGCVDALIIKNRPEKPYYLEKVCKPHRSKLYPGTIYTRVRDTNTAIDTCASSSDIEAMWKERFGISKTPLQRLEQYLLDFSGWERAGEERWYYKQFPEFTIQETDDEIKEVKCGENWVRAACDPVSHVCPMRLMYHQTDLLKIPCLYFDNFSLLLPAPEPALINEHEHLYFYFYTADTINFAFVQFLLKKSKQELLDKGIINSRLGGTIPIVIFKSMDDKNNFITSLKTKKIHIKDKHQFTFNTGDKLITEHDRRIIAYTNAVNETYLNSKEKL